MIIWDILIKSQKCFNSWGASHQINSCKVSFEKTSNLKNNLIWFIFKGCGCKAINFLFCVVFSQFCFLSLYCWQEWEGMTAGHFMQRRTTEWQQTPGLAVTMVLSLSIFKAVLLQTVVHTRDRKRWVGHTTAAFSLWPILSPQLCRMSC